MKKIKLGKDLSIGTGVGIGTVQLVAIVKYLPGQVWPVFGNIVIGGLALAASIYKYKRGTAHYSLLGYGFTTLFGGLVTGIMAATGWAAGAGARADAQARQMAMAQEQAMVAPYNGYLTHEYYPGVQGDFVRRPESRARGFASDVTINPMASIPTTIPYGHIIA